MTRPKRPSSYSIDQSPLYKLEARRKLAALLEMATVDLTTLTARTDNYDIFPLKRNEKPRRVESPKYILRRLHSKLFDYLQRIATPIYLHSGIRGRSYITNARVHLENKSLLKVDISEFYPSVKRASIKRMFREQFLCSEDVAALLADLCTVNSDGGHGRSDGHVPTGSPLSQMLAYYTHKKLFDRLQEYAQSRSITMTCYVDDLVFSGVKIVVADREAICSLIRKAGLKPNTKKTRLYRPNQAKKVTGVILINGQEKVPNSLRRDIDNQFRLLNCVQGEANYTKNLQKLVGQLRAAGQIEPYFSNLGSALQPALSAAQRAEAQQKRGAA